MIQRPKPARLAALLLVGALVCAGAPGARADEGTRAIMGEVFDTIAYLLPLSVREPDPAAGGDAELLERKLQVLADASKALAAHGGGGESEFGLLARSFERGVADIRSAFDSHYPAFAYFALMDLTQHCAACHARLPDARNFDFGQRLMARMDVDALDPEDLAQLYVATRQFDRARDVLENLLLSPEQDPVDLDLAGTLVEYLNVSISVAQDLARPRALLAKLAARPDMPYYMQRRLAAWQAAIDEVGGALVAAPDLATARRLFDSATGLTVAPGGRERTVHDLVAASILRRWEEANREAPAAERAEAYYLLGAIALRTTELKPAVPEMELLFEAAIRADPKGPFAAPSYALLEEYGFINDQHLARGTEGGSLLDMAALRKLVAP